MSRNVPLSQPQRERLEYHVNTNHERVDRHPRAPAEFRKDRLLTIHLDAHLCSPDAQRLLDVIEEIGLAMRARGSEADLGGADKEWFEAIERVLGPTSASDVAESVVDRRKERKG